MPRHYDELVRENESLREQADESEDIRRQLRKSEDKIARLMDSLPGMAYRCTIGEGYTYSLEFVSRGSIDLLGYTPDDLVRGRKNTIERMTHPDDLERMRRDVLRGVLERTPYKTMYRVTMSSGEVKWIWDQGEAVYDEQGVAVGLEGIIMDVSAQKMQELRLQEENERLRSSVKGSCGLGEIVGKSEAMNNVYTLILKAAQSDTSVIILGETGTGKDLVARTIHELSGRPGKYVPVNCGAIPEQLLESEFFGHKKGAFSGAVDTRQGYLAAADGGTLFLDELGELSLGLQVKLLRAIETKQYIPVGETVPRRSDFRLVSATNRDLKEMVQQKTMRADFFYRVHVLSIHLPPVRARKEDIPLLIDSILSRKTGVENSAAMLPPGLRIALENYDWPGNIREMQNLLDRYVTFGEIDFLELSGKAPEVPLEADLREAGALTFDEAVARYEKALLLKALERNRWRKAETAQALGLNLRTMQRKIRQYGI
ncbi:MAG TPA: sigma 54-interacting transcriptional regulator [Desulfovibrio sp.]|uniref:sigma-54 interaction domain-containing protein n=1 Tax=Desulfovibrio sp. TaxID=885 RepID=UPI002B8B43A7|nr:sigma 54-interacting transcriptional regulator [Desulfovibrio sp.]HMM38822.1 sigma 54-interacting transcriptional regulator [Desulfovibrio sp.]